MQTHAGDDIEQGYLRIGELSRRTGVSPDTLRAWERRYGVLRPQRTSGGFRLYTPADETRIRDMRSLLDAGLAPAEAARRALEASGRGLRAAAPPSGDPIADLREALEGFDAEAANLAIDRVSDALGLESLVSHVVMPYLRDLGDRWAAGEVSVAQEHFASGVIRARLAERSRGWDEGSGRRALLACAPQEHHDLALLCFGLAMREHGWRVTMLGADTPVPVVADAALRIGAEVVVIAASVRERFADHAEALRQLAALAPLVLAGPGATREIARLVGARLEVGDPVSVARRLTLTGDEAPADRAAESA